MRHIPATLRRPVYDRAQGRCEYCLVPDALTLAPHEVDHIIAYKHGGSTEAENLALCCTLCNKHKGSDLSSLDPATGELVPLFHPRRDRWSDHFQIAGGLLEPRTPHGRVTVRLLQLNQPDRIAERKLLVIGGLLPVQRAGR